MLTQKELKKILKYNYNTGAFTWIKRLSNRSIIGKSAGSLSNGYILIMIEGKNYRAHRLAWLYHYGYMPENGIDHINRDKSDNRIENLREVSQQCNTRNTSNFKHNTSGVKGVSWFSRTNKWIARIKVNGKEYHLGYHKDLIEAVAHRLAAEQCLDWQGCDSSSPAYMYMREWYEGNKRVDKPK